MMNLPPDVGVVACKIFEPELTALGIEESRVVYLDQSLHRDPQELHGKLADTLGRLEKETTLQKVVLLYGYCGGGLEGLMCNRLKLVVPLAHDCIPLLLGTKSDNSRAPCADAFYLSPGWIDHGQTPYTEYFVSARKYGQEDALWMGKEMLKSYREVILVENEARLWNHHRCYARKMARLFELVYREYRGNKDWLLKLLAAQVNNGVNVIKPGNPITLDHYPMGQSLTRPQLGEGVECRSK